jgi:type I restriction enzyme S subunit
VTSGNKTNPLKIQIADVCRIGNGYAFKSPEYRDNGIPLLRISNIANERVSFDKGTIYLDENCLVTHKDFVVNKGDVLIALSGATTGKYGIYELEEPCLLNQRIGIIRSGNSKDLDSKYFYFYLSELRSEILRKAQGAAQPNISTKEIGQFKIPLPPLPEQQKIASILDAADNLRQKDQQLIEKYTALSQSLFLEMFGDPETNSMAWDITALGKTLIDIVGGKSVGGEQRQITVGEKAVLKISAVTTGIFNALEYKVVESSEVPETLVHPLKGNLLFSRANTRDLVGATCIVDDDYEYLFLPDKISFNA